MLTYCKTVYLILRKMRVFGLIVPITSILLSLVKADSADCSFYDDPLPQIPEGGTPKEELDAKWGAEV